MRAPLVRAGLLLVAALLVLAAACGGSSDDEAATARPATLAPPPSSTPSVPAERTPEPTPDPLGAATASPTPTAPPPPAPSPWPAHHPAGTRTGVAQVDAVIAALEASDVDALVALALLHEIECVPPESVLGVGGLICDEGEQPGEALHVFQSMQCEGFFVRESQLREHLAWFAQSSLGAYAAVEVREPARGRGFGPAAPLDYVVAMTAREQGLPGFAGGQAALLQGSKLIATQFGCKTPGDYLTWGGQAHELLLPPPAP